MNINLGALKVAQKKSTKPEKPTLPDSNGALAAIVEQGIQAKQNKEAWEATLKTTNAALAERLLPHLFAAHHGCSGEPEDSFKAIGNGGYVMLSFKNAYKLPEDVAKVRAVLGEEIAARFLRQSFTIEIDSSAIPEFVLQTFVDKLTELARGLDEMCCGTEDGQVGPVMNAITVKQEVTVAKSFHAERHRLFTPEQNARIQQVMPAQVSATYKY